MRWTEQAIADDLGASRFRMIWDYGRCEVLDINAVESQALKKKNTWTDEDLVNLVIYKRRGDTMDTIEVALDKERSRIQHKWTHRAEWMSTISVPADPVIIQNPVDRKRMVCEAILSLADANCDPALQMRVQDIADAVCKVYGIGKNDFVGERRSKKFCDARHVCFWVARKFTSYSFPLIGRVCGDRDHSTVVHGVQRVEKNFPAFSGRIINVLKILGIETEVIA